MTLGLVPQLFSLLVGGGVDALLGWRILRARVWRHSFYDEVRIGMSRQQYARHVALSAGSHFARVTPVKGVTGHG